MIHGCIMMLPMLSARTSSSTAGREFRKLQCVRMHMHVQLEAQAPASETLIEFNKCLIGHRVPLPLPLWPTRSQWPTTGTRPYSCE